jgi:hypothetical protein
MLSGKKELGFRSHPFKPNSYPFLKYLSAECWVKRLSHIQFSSLSSHLRASTFPLHRNLICRGLFYGSPACSFLAMKRDDFKLSYSANSTLSPLPLQKLHSKAIIIIHVCTYLGGKQVLTFWASLSFYTVLTRPIECQELMMEWFFSSSKNTGSHTTPPSLRVDLMHNTHI